VLPFTPIRDCAIAGQHASMLGESRKRALICRAIQARISCADPAPAAKRRAAMQSCMAAMQICMAAMQAAMVGHAATSGGEA
jgi:hypothetical protein